MAIVDDVIAETEQTEEKKQAAIDSHRLRLMRVDSRCILAFFSTPQHEYLSLPHCTSLPKDYKLLAVSHSFEMDCFLFKIWSMEFPTVPAGERIPVIDGEWTVGLTAYRRT